MIFLINNIKKSCGFWFYTFRIPTVKDEKFSLKTRGLEMENQL